MLEIDDPHGLVCGDRVDATGGMTSLDWAGMDAALAADGALVWLHFDQSDSRARAWIEADPRVPAAGKTMLLGTDARMRTEAAGAGLCGVAGDLPTRAGRSRWMIGRCDASL